MKIIAWTATAVLAAFGAASAAEAAFTVTVSAPGVQHGAPTLTYGGEQTFDGLATCFGCADYDWTFYPANGLKATFSAFDVMEANFAGGSGGTGNYLAASNWGTELSFRDATVNYFGLWVSSLDEGNVVTFYRNGSFVGEYNLFDIVNALPGASAYQGAAFFNFRSDLVFDEVVMAQNVEGGFEIDNLNLGYIAPVIATPLAEMPEPGSWATMLIGFGVAGAAIRRRRRMLPA